MLRKPRNGQELAVFGRVLGAGAAAAGEVIATGAGSDGRAAAAGGGAAGAADGSAATIACTSFWLRTRGGFDVTMVADR